jgi:Tfp pilus assembly protein PilN
MLFLNLATRPARNRKFFLLARAALAAACVAFLGMGAFTMVKYGLQLSRLKTSLAETEILQGAVGREQSRLLADVSKEKQEKDAEIDTVNRIIYQKSFSWTGLFSELEASLPESVYITSFVPNFSGEWTVTLKVKVVSVGLDDLLVFLNNLNARKFTYRFESESREEEGQLVSEISLSYERVI